MQLQPMCDADLANLIDWIQQVNTCRDYVLLYWTVMTRASADILLLQQKGFKTVEWFTWNKTGGRPPNKFRLRGFLFAEVCIAATRTDTGVFLRRPEGTNLENHFLYPVPNLIRHRGEIVNGAQKSLRLMLQLLNHFSPKGSQVLDLFSGTGKRR